MNGGVDSGRKCSENQTFSGLAASQLQCRGRFHRRTYPNIARCSRRVGPRQVSESAFLAEVVNPDARNDPGAVRMIALYVSEPTVHELLPYAWQAAAGMHAFVGGARPPKNSAVQNVDFDPDDLIERALATGDEHAIKFTEVCLRERALTRARGCLKYRIAGARIGGA